MNIRLHQIMQRYISRMEITGMYHHISRFVPHKPIIIFIEQHLLDLRGCKTLYFVSFWSNRSLSFCTCNSVFPAKYIAFADSVFFFGSFAVYSDSTSSYPCINIPKFDFRRAFEVFSQKSVASLLCLQRGNCKFHIKLTKMK